MLSFKFTENAQTAFRDSIIIAIMLTTLYYSVAFGFGWIKEVNWVELVAILTSFSCTYMCNWQTRWNYPMGVITTVFYSWLFFQSPETIALAIFNLYLVFSLAYGWFRWRDDNNTRPVSRMTVNDWLIHIMLGVAVFALFIWVCVGVDMYLHEKTLSQAIEALSWIDVSLAAASGVAQFALDNKKLENWVIWLLVDIVSIPYFIHVGLYGAAFQYMFFGANTIWAFSLWLKDYRQREQDTTYALAV